MCSAAGSAASTTETIGIASKIQVFQAVAKEKGLSVHDVPPDGNCAVHALCDQLSLVGLSTDVSHFRRIAVDFLKTRVQRILAYNIIV